MATKTYKIKRKVSATESEEVKIPASSVDGLSIVATSGSYNDLSNKPTIPSATEVVQATGTSATAVMSQKATTDELAKRARIDEGNTFNGDQFIQNGFVGDTAEICGFDYNNPDAPYLLLTDGSRVHLDNGYGTSGQVFTSRGAGTAPEWATPTKGTVTQVKINGTTKSPNSAGLVDLGTISGGSSNVTVEKFSVNGVGYTVFAPTETGSFIGICSTENNGDFDVDVAGIVFRISPNEQNITYRLTIDKGDFSSNYSIIYVTIVVDGGTVEKDSAFKKISRGGGYVTINTNLTSSYQEHNSGVIIKGVTQ